MAEYDGYGKTVISGPDPAATENASEVQELGALPGLSDEEFAELCKSILVVIPYRGGEGINQGIAKHFGMWGVLGLRYGTVQDPHGGFIEVQRGLLVRTFREYAYNTPDIKYLVMIDNDQEIKWDAPLQLARHGKPIVSGVICGYSSQRGVYACFTAKDENGVARFPSFRDTKFLPSNGLIEVEQCGTGLVCIRRDVLDTIAENGEQPFFVPEEERKHAVEIGNIKKSEDICFCERAQRYGFQTYVDLSVHGIHFKTIPLSWPVDCLDDNIDAIDWKPSVFDYKGVV